MATNKYEAGKTTTPRNAWAVAGAAISSAARDRIILGGGAAVAVVLLLGRLLGARAGGGPTAGALSLLVALFFGSLLIVPALLAEERVKQARGQMAASAGATLVGMGLAGLVFGLVGAAVALLIYAGLIVRWDAAILAAVLAVTFGLSLGLLIDLLVDASRLILWLVAVGLVLLLPALALALFGADVLAEAALLRWVPTVALLRLFETALGGAAAALLSSVLAVVTPTVIMMAAAGWLTRRVERG